MSLQVWLERHVGLPLLRLHGRIYQLSGGRIGHHIPGAPPSLLLHTEGARTGAPRTSALTYARDRDDYLVVASNGGERRAPGWLFNLRAHPDAAINVGTRRRAVHARAVTPEDPEYGRLWEVVNANNADRYNGYQSRTARPIPVVVLSPTS